MVERGRILGEDGIIRIPPNRAMAIQIYNQWLIDNQRRPEELLLPLEFIVEEAEVHTRRTKPNEYDETVSYGLVIFCRREKPGEPEDFGHNSYMELKVNYAGELPIEFLDTVFDTIAVKTLRLPDMWPIEKGDRIRAYILVGEILTEREGYGCPKRQMESRHLVPKKGMSQELLEPPEDIKLEEVETPVRIEKLKDGKVVCTFFYDSHTEWGFKPYENKSLQQD